MIAISGGPKGKGHAVHHKAMTTHAKGYCRKFVPRGPDKVKDNLNRVGPKPSILKEFP